MNSATTGPWTYYTYPSDTPAVAFGPLTGFVEIWNRKRPTPEIFPCWPTFDLMDFEGWWGQISLAELHESPFDLRWALWGTSITEWWGVDYSNKFISDLPAVRKVWEVYERPYLRHLVDDRLIGFVSGALAPQDRDFKYIMGVDLPLEVDGRITHILSAYVLREPDEDFVPAIDVFFKR